MPFSPDELRRLRESANRIAREVLAEMAAVTHCVVCDTPLPASRLYVYTCSDRCFTAPEGQDRPRNNDREAGNG